RVFNQPERRLKRRFNGFAGFLVPNHQASGGTVAGLVFNNFPDFGVVSLPDQIPNPAFRVAEAGKRAQVLLIGEQQGGAFNGLGLFQVGLMAGGFRAIETNLRVGAVAEGFAGGLAAAAEGILRRCREFFPFAVIERIALGIGDNPLFTQRRAAADEIGAVLGDFNLRMGLRALF